MLQLSFPGQDIVLPIEPFVSVGGGILIALTTGGFGLLSIWLNKRLNAIDVKTAPTGNGYAARTEDALKRIEAQGEKTATQLDKLTDRFNAHIDTDRKANA